jgi:hypothetical protein
MKKYFLILNIGLLYTFSALSQNDIDAMRYSQTSFGGTARFSSMAGSMGALGGDISTLNFNPAGIALFRKTEFTITPSLFSQNTSSSYNNMTGSDGKLNLNLSNIGFVATFHPKKTDYGWQSFNLGLVYNQTNSFQSRSYAQGYNNNSSLLDGYVQNANGHTSSDFDQFSTGLAWDTYLINPTDTTSGNTRYSSVIPNHGELQTKSTETSGSMSETDLSFGGNYKDKLFIGGTIGFVRVKYTEETVYSEAMDKADSVNGFKSFSYTSNLTTRGNGINFKVGIIYKATDWLRIGLAVHTPTYISLSDSYSNSMHSEFADSTHDASSPSGSFNYSVITPFKAIGSLGFVLNKYALINAEYEYVDYSSVQIHSSPDVFQSVNSFIHSNYTATGNIRIGGELRLDPIAFRLGYALYGSPYKTGDNKNAVTPSYTAGIGFRQKRFFMDFAYVYTTQTTYNYLYTPLNAADTPVKNNYQSSNFMLTLGFRL